MNNCIHILKLTNIIIQAKWCQEKSWLCVTKGKCPPEGKNWIVFPGDQTDSQDGSRQRAEGAINGNTKKPSIHPMNERSQAKVFEVTPEAE
jgi:hypothetical protein